MDECVVMTPGLGTDFREHVPKTPIKAEEREARLGTFFFSGAVGVFVISGWRMLTHKEGQQVVSPTDTKIEQKGLISWVGFTTGPNTSWGAVGNRPAPDRRYGLRWRLGVSLVRGVDNFAQLGSPS